MSKKSMIVFFLLVSATACAGGQTVKEVPAPVVTAPTPPPVAVAQTAPPPAVAAPEPAPEKPARKIIEKMSWTLKQGKLSKQPAAKLVAKSKDKNGHDFIEKCWNYGDFAIYQTQVEGELGAAEAFVRYGNKGLCNRDFSGRTSNLDISEGFFAGVAGGFVVSDGAEIADGLREFQIFTLDTGKIAFKGAHHPSAEVALSKSGNVVSLDFFAKVRVDCELAGEDGASCWKKVLAANGIKKATPMPDCKGSFKRAKKDFTEPAFVTVPARIGNLAAPKVEFVGGAATCDPEA